MPYEPTTMRTYYRFEEIPDTKPSAVAAKRRTTEAVPATLESYGRANRVQARFDEPRFWRRQFGSEVTRMQKAFDWTFGVWLPLFCFFIDPIVFRDGFSPRGDGLLGAFQIFAYSLGFISVVSMAGWLLLREKLGWLNGWVAGLFFAGSLVSLAVGVVLSPFAFIGMFMIIGFLGYTPLISGVIYLRNGVRATRAAALFYEKRVLVHVAMLAGLASLALPWVLNQILR